MKNKIMILMLLIGLVVITGCSSNRVAVINTNYGDIEVKLYEDKVPITTKNFIDLAEIGFYDNLTFHRIVPKFVIQGGCPNGDGTGNPGYAIVDEFDASLSHDAVGILSMANAGPDTGGSQFFITLTPQSQLDNRHSVFGKVIKGMEVVKEIENVPTGPMNKPLRPVIINTIRIK